MIVQKKIFIFWYRMSIIMILLHTKISALKNLNGIKLYCLYIYWTRHILSLSSLLHNGCWEVLEVKLYLLQFRRNLRTLVLNLQTQTRIVISMKISIHTERNNSSRITNLSNTMKLCSPQHSVCLSVLTLLMYD